MLDENLQFDEYIDESIANEEWQHFFTCVQNIYVKYGSLNLPALITDGLLKIGQV